MNDSNKTLDLGTTQAVKAPEAHKNKVSADEIRAAVDRLFSEPGSRLRIYFDE